jgi:hypothetical protein
MRCAIYCLLLSVPASVFAQSGATLVSAGYMDPAVTVVSPGQDITFYLSGVPTLLAQPVEARAHLPYTLAGFSAKITQTGSSDVLNVPLYSVRQIDLCAASQQATPACFVTALRVQIPFEIALYANAQQGKAQISFSEVADSSRAFSLLPVPSQIFLKACPDRQAASPTRMAH